MSFVDPVFQFFCYCWYSMNYLHVCLWELYVQFNSFILLFWLIKVLVLFWKNCLKWLPVLVWMHKPKSFCWFFSQWRQLRNGRKLYHCCYDVLDKIHILYPNYLLNYIVVYLNYFLCWLYIALGNWWETLYKLCAFIILMFFFQWMAKFIQFINCVRNFFKHTDKQCIQIIIYLL